MLKQKYANARPKRRPIFSIGVFLLVIAGIWFASFKLIGGSESATKKSIFDIGPNNTQDQGSIFGSSGEYPVLVMFDNHPDSVAYQVGLAQALVVYEVLAEGGSTRFMGLYNGAPEDADKIGPVRSARPYVVEIASGWSAFFLHAGGSPEALELIPKTEVIDLNEISGLGIRYFWRDNDVPRPHNLFTSGDLIALGIEDFALTLLPREKLLWKWDDNPPAPKKDALLDAVSVYIDFSEGIGFDASYEYDARSKTYKRFMGSLAHLDTATGKQLTAANIIIQKVPTEGYYPSGLGRISLDLIGEGDMILFQRGYAVAGTWSKESRDSQTEWLDEDGEPIVLATGQTWVEVVPGGRPVIYE